MKRMFAAILLSLPMIVATGAQPQAPFKRTIVQQGDLSVAGREVIQAVVDIQPGGAPGRHTHPGEEVGYVLEGTILLQQDGKPDVVVSRMANPMSSLRQGTAFSSRPEQFTTP